MKHLSRTQLEQLRQLLDRSAQRVRERIAYERARAEEDHALETAGEDGDDDADKAFAELRASIQRELLNCHVAELRGLESALERFEARRYGLCVDCHSPIEYARLEAQPAAERCARCQNVHERTFADRERLGRI